jgi:hypothetical protein
MLGDFDRPEIVIAGLDPAIQPSSGALREAWMRGSSPHMTMRAVARALNFQPVQLNRTRLG